MRTTDGRPTNVTKASKVTTFEGQPVLEAIAHGLSVTDRSIPEKVIKAARSHRAEIVPYLTDLIARATNQVRAEEEVDGNGHFIALLLLGEFRAKKGLPTIIEALSLPGESPFDLFGDGGIHETVPRVLAALGHDQIDVVFSLIQNQELAGGVRASAVHALVRMVAARFHPRETILPILQQELRTAIELRDTHLATTLVLALCDLYPEEAYEEIKKACNEGLVEDGLICLEDIDDLIQEGQEAAMARLTKPPVLIEDSIAQLKKATHFGKRKPTTPTPMQIPRQLPRIPEAGPGFDPSPRPIVNKERVGRNDPCPCGSGKKFKKCCGVRK
ncbi:MAG: DUF1186 domain-containing protein [Gemmataceae bacterium]